MQLFRWSSSALKQYRDGHIVVMAPDLDTARQKVERMIGPLYRRTRFYIEDDEPHYLLDLIHESEMEDWLEWRDKIVADITKTPDQDDILFIQGSE